MPVKKSVRAKKPADGATQTRPSSAPEPANARPLSTAAIALVAVASLTGVALLFGAAGSNGTQGGDVQSSAPTPSPALVKTAAAANAAPAVRPTPASVVSGAVTMAGCLEKTGNGFRLKDTSGDAPKSRSWKSGFLKKGSVPITIVGASGEVRLADHVGERVNVSGALIDREMHVQTLRRISASCK